MRIAHVTDFYLPRLGGIETHIAGLADHQRRIGHDVDVIAAGGLVESSDADALLAECGNATFDSFRRPAIKAATTSVLHGGYDAVHVHAGLATPLAFTVARAASLAGVPTVVTVHSVLGSLTPLYRVFDQMTRWSRLPIAWTAVSRMSAAPVQDLVGAEHHVGVLPNAVDADAWNVDHPPHDEHRLVVAAVMRLAPRKRPMQLLRVLRAVRLAVPPDVKISVIIIGEGSERRPMERYLSRHDMSRWVRLPGSFTHAQIHETFRHTDVFVAPAIQESFGIAALEARAAGLPVIAMERAGIREFIEHDRSGLLVADDAGMVDALTRLIVEPATRARIAEHNRSTRFGFDWPNTLNRTALAYERAAELQATSTYAGRAQPVMATRRLPVMAAHAFQDGTA